MVIVLTEIVKTGIRAYGEYATKDFADFCVGDLVRIQSIRNGIDDKVSGRLECITANQLYVRTKLCLVPIMTEDVYHINEIEMEDLV